MTHSLVQFTEHFQGAIPEHRGMCSPLWSLHMVWPQTKQKDLETRNCCDTEERSGGEGIKLGTIKVGQYQTTRYQTQRKFSPQIQDRAAALPLANVDIIATSLGPTLLFRCTSLYNQPS